MLLLAGQMLLRNATWVGITTMWYGWKWFFPSKKDRMDAEIYTNIKVINDRNGELTREITNIKHMIRDDLNIPETVNMNEYINIVNTLEEMEAPTMSLKIEN